MPQFPEKQTAPTRPLPRREKREFDRRAVAVRSRYLQEHERRQQDSHTRNGEPSPFSRFCCWIFLVHERRLERLQIFEQLVLLVVRQLRAVKVAPVAFGSDAGVVEEVTIL